MVSGESIPKVDQPTDYSPQSTVQINLFFQTMLYALSIKHSRLQILDLNTKNANL